MKLKKIIIILLLTFTLTGCTQIMKDSKGKVVINPSTSQNLTKNIICQPNYKKVRKIYTDNKVNLNKLPKCENIDIFKASDDSLWTNVFIKPLATLIIKIGLLFKNYGLAVIVTGLLIRIVFIPITKKTAKQSENMKKAKPELDALEKKFKGKTEQDDLMKKNQQMMLIYKKYQINPVSGCLFAFIQLPIFFAFYETINRVPALFEGTFLTLNLGMTPLKGVSTGNYIYILLVIILALVTYYSFNLNKQDMVPGATPAASKNMMYFMLGFIVLASLNLSTAILLYWITSSTFTIVQNYIVSKESEVHHDKK